MKLKSIYDNNELNLKGDITITLSEEERNMICNALAILLPKECHAMPIVLLVNKITIGE